LNGGRKFRLGRLFHERGGFAREQPERTGKKFFANRSNKKKIAKKPHAGRGHETMREIPINNGTRLPGQDYEAD
jgi:hypothetical protein